ncbi:MAG: molybdopterin-dependent oxidoreductase, partial [Syntrophales bacterium LBB04]|nr:molybdopterin-dependent oxidoreductase [Syntrophales bacterium LBB04]
MNEDVLCERCNEPFIDQKGFQQILTVLKEKRLEQYLGLFKLCPKCRREAFCQELLGSDLRKVARVPTLIKRRNEKIEPIKVDSRTGATVYKSTCFICNAGCDATVWVKDGKVAKVEGDLSSPVTGGTLCAKGLASKHILYHPDRLKYPMKRVGERGEGKWVRIAWDEALDTIATRFKEIEEKYGKDSIACTTGTSRGWVPTFTRFANAWGKQWSGPGVAQCFAPRSAAQSLTFGGSPIECPDYSSTRCMLVWGCNPVNTWQWKARGMMEAWANGTKLIVVDPVLSESASKADLWLQVRPGTDTALALGMLNVIITEGLYDLEFVRRWCLGFDEFKERIGDYPPRKVEEITWVPADKIIEAARLYATTRPASITQIVAVDQNADT